MRNRSGFTPMELLLAVVTLVVLATTTARLASEFSKAMTKSSARVIAAGVAADRLELVRVDPRYPRLFSLYGTGAGADTTGFPGYPAMRRLTSIVRNQSGNPTRDRTTITMRVTEPSMRDTVAVSAVIASP